MKTPNSRAPETTKVALRYIDYYSMLSLKDFMDLVASGWNGDVHSISHADR